MSITARPERKPSDKHLLSSLSFGKSVTRLLKTRITTAIIYVHFVLLVGEPSIAQQITYAYDAAGRLVGVVDPSGNAAAYKYDATGNILSIQRYTASQTGVFNFAPINGPVGMAVTVNGTGFSATPSQDIVKFNGTAATIASATPTQIVAVVPPGATTGSITVTSPLGTATSSSQFVVSGTTPAPFITSFTPVIANPGGTVTITGGNFASPATSNDVKVNLGIVSVNSVSGSTLSVTIPPDATSGRISVSTPAGQAVSTGDLFIQPAGHVVPSGSTGRMSIGSSATLSVPGGFYTGLMIFDAVAPQRISVVNSGNTGTGGLFNGMCTTLFDPQGNAIGYGACHGGGFAGIDLLISGTYTLRVTSEQVDVAPTITINNIVNFTSPITINGSAVLATLSTSGQEGVLTFTGSQNQSITINATNSTDCFSWTLTDPLGTVHFLSTPCGSSFTLPVTLTGSGAYTLTIASPFSGTGSVNVALTSP